MRTEVESPETAEQKSAGPLPEDCRDLLGAMIRIESVNGHLGAGASTETRIGRYMEACAAQLGLTTQRLPVAGAGFNLLITHEKDPSAPWILFDSHLDTVAVDGMKDDPFSGEVRGGKIYGRGACDTKGSGAAMLWALSKYAAGEGSNNVALLFSVDEEYGKTGIRTFVGEQLPALSWQPVGAVVGEPTHLRMVVAHKGVFRWNIRTKGVAAHSSDPSRGKSAISMMAKVVDALESRYIPGLKAEDSLAGKAACSINLIRGGNQINIIPAECEIQLDRRLVPGEEPGDVLPEVERILDQVRTENPGLEVVQGTPFVDRPLHPDGAEAFLAGIGESLASVGLPDEWLGANYGTNASDLYAAGIPTVVIGPGDIAQAHSEEEWLELQELDRAVELYLRIMETPLRGAAS